MMFPTTTDDEMMFNSGLCSVQMTPADIKNIREIAKRDDVLELLAKSLAPSIYGHDHIKKALVLQLLVSCHRKQSLRCFFFP